MSAAVMDSDGFERKETDEMYILVTGTNSGLGLSICRRLIDEFLATRPKNESLTLIFTTRSSKKSDETLTQLKNHLRSATSESQPAGGDNTERIKLKPENVDLGDLLSVRALARRLTVSIPKLDVLVLNAGVAGFKGLNWFRAVYQVLTDLVHAVTWPSSYVLSDTGVMNKKQTNLPDEPPMGNLFCANIFGHYLLTHYLMPLLDQATPCPARIIWTSSLEATKEVFNIADIQGLQTSRAYESCKYLTDVLAITSSLPSTSPWVDNYFGSSPKQQPKNNNKSKKPDSQPSTRPSMYLAHPGVCATSILPLILPLYYAMLGAAWLARLFGSPWHVLTSYRGANAAVWLSLTPQPVLDAAEGPYERLGGGKGKWGSSCDRLGRERVACTEIEGWGFGGVVGGPVLEADKQMRRKRGAKNLTAEDKVEFEDLGRKCWQEMETLRMKWEDILSKTEATEGAGVA